MFPKKKPETELPAAYQLAEYTFERVNALAERVRKLEPKTTTGRPAPGAPLPPALHPEAAPGEDILILKDRLSARSEQLADAHARLKVAEGRYARLSEDFDRLHRDLKVAYSERDAALAKNGGLERDLARYMPLGIELTAENASLRLQLADTLARGANLRDVHNEAREDILELADVFSAWEKKLDDAHTENAELKRDLAKMAAHAGTMIQELYFVREQAAIWRELYVNLKAARA